MANTFHRMGGAVYFTGYLVATLCADAPATVLDEVGAALDTYDPEAVSAEDHDAALKEKDEEMDAALNEAQVEIDELERRVRELEAELDALDEQRSARHDD